MTASFGVLQNRTLELSPGLNIVEAPNEYGKTTWCAFLRAMLYGIDTAQRGRARKKAGQGALRSVERFPDGGDNGDHIRREGHYSFALDAHSLGAHACLFRCVFPLRSISSRS